MTQSAPRVFAAGIPAVASAMKHILTEAGVFRGTRGLLEMNQAGGFDCPSCAWPEADGERSIAEFCENGAKALDSETTQKLADRNFFARYSVAELAKESDFWHEKQGRIAEPMILVEGATHYTPVSWEDAFRLIAEHLQSLPSPKQATFYTSGRASNEAEIYVGAFRCVVGTLCASPSGWQSRCKKSQRGDTGGYGKKSAA